MNAKDIARSLGGHVDTVKRFVADPARQSDARVLKAVTTRELRLVQRKLLKKPGQTSKTIFTEAHLSKVSKST